MHAGHPETQRQPQLCEQQAAERQFSEGAQFPQQKPQFSAV